MSSGPADIVAAFSLGSDELVGLACVERQDDAALVDRLDLLGIGEAPASGTAAPVDHEAVEDVGVGVGQHVLDHADALAVAAQHRRALLEDEVRDGVSEIHG